MELLNGLYKLDSDKLNITVRKNTGNIDEDGNIVGLIPMSSVGEIDSTASRLTLYEKGSLTTTDGGYRLMASRVENYDLDTDGETKIVTAGEAEGKGFVAFDLFVMNLSGNEYYDEYNQLNSFHQFQELIHF